MAQLKDQLRKVIDSFIRRQRVATEGVERMQKVAEEAKKTSEEIKREKAT